MNKNTLVAYYNKYSKKQGVTAKHAFMLSLFEVYNMDLERSLPEIMLESFFNEAEFTNKRAKNRLKKEVVELISILKQRNLKNDSK